MDGAARPLGSYDKLRALGEVVGDIAIKLLPSVWIMSALLEGLILPLALVDRISAPVDDITSLRACDFKKAGLSI